MARRLRTGTVNNNGDSMSAYASLGGVGMSGMDRERGIDGIRIYQNLRRLNVL